MNKFLMVLVTLLVTMFAVNASAYTPPPAPANGGYVVDQAGKLSPGQIQQLNRKIDAISKSTKNEFGVLLLPNMGGDNIEDVANATYKAWGVGKRGLDNGCLIVVAIKERKSRIETGKGVEGEVTDLQSKDILLKNLNPHLRSGDFYGGFDETLGTLSALMESRHNQKADPAPVATTTATAQPVADTSTTQKRTGCNVSSAPAPSSGGTWVVILLLGVGGTVALLMARAAKRRREREEQERLAAAKRRREKEAQIRQLQARLAQEKERKETLAKATPPVTVPIMPSRPVASPPPVPVARVAVKPHVAPHPVSRAGVPIDSVVPTRPEPPPIPRPSPVVDALAAGAAVLAAAEAAHEATLRRERSEREDEERRARQRERDEEDRRRRDREDEDRRRRDSESSSYSSSSSSWDSGGSSGGGFGGGDSGGGGSSSDW